MVTVQSVLADIRAQFRAAHLDTPDLDARLLVQAATGLTQEQLVMSAQAVTDKQNKKLAEMVKRRLAHEPVSRILGRRAFWKSEFRVTPDTLDPRADSETVIEAVVKYADKNKPLRVLDLGTGTGCLLLSALQELPRATGLGVDISAGAVDTARQNAADLNLSSRASFITRDWEDLTPERFDIIISNPPYIKESEIPGLAPEVKNYDPRTALAAGADGLDCYRVLSRLMPALLNDNGLILLEIGSTQADSVKAILAERRIRVLQVLPDLCGHNRCVIATASDWG